MPQSEKKTDEAEGKKPAEKTAKKDATEEQEPSPPQLNREQLESLREKLQRKFH